MKILTVLLINNTIKSDNINNIKINSDSINKHNINSANN